MIKNRLLSSFVIPLLFPVFFSYSCNSINNNDTKIYTCPKNLSNRNKNLIKIINKYRKNHNKHSLFVDVEISKIAFIRAKNIGQTRVFSHIDLRGKTPMQRLRKFGINRDRVAENLSFMMPKYSHIKQVVFSWSKKKKENDILLSSDYYRFGSGFFRTGDLCIVVGIFSN